MENPKPVLVCKIEATKIIRMKIIIVSKKILLFSLSKEVNKNIFYHINCFFYFQNIVNG